MMLQLLRPLTKRPALTTLLSQLPRTCMEIIGTLLPQQGPLTNGQLAVYFGRLQSAKEIAPLAMQNGQGLLLDEIFLQHQPFAEEWEALHCSYCIFKASRPDSLACASIPNRCTKGGPAETLHRDGGLTGLIYLTAGRSGGWGGRPRGRLSAPKLGKQTGCKTGLRRWVVRIGSQNSQSISCTE